jgi:hypothetical protein
MRIKVFALALILSLFSSLSLVTPVQAVGMTPLQGIVGTTVTISDLLVGASYIVRWDGTSYKVGTVPLSADVTFTVPDASGGDHDVEVETSPPGTPVFTDSFTVLPSIDIDPNVGMVGASVTVTGKGFAAAEGSIVITYGGTNVKTGITADDDGSWSATFVVPSSTTGSHVVDASGSTTDAADVADKTFTVSPKISIDPISGCVGTSVTVSGTGFAAAETAIKVTYAGITVRTGMVAKNDGSWNTTFVVPGSIKGGHAVDASGSTTEASDVADVTFTVSPGLSVEPTSGYVGDEIEVNGSGFASNESGIKVTLDGVVVKSGIKAGEDGYWETSFTIPTCVTGAHAIDSYGNTTIATDVSDATLTVLVQMVLSPESGNVGDDIRVKGTGFSGEKDLTVSYDDVTVVTGLSTDAEGNFSTSFKAPKGKSGEINVTATDTIGVTASAIFTMETTPPDIPLVASPKDGSTVGFIGDTKVTFDWTDVSDPSGVHYALEVSPQFDFGITLTSHTDLNNSKYTLTEAESLPHGEYYWRVQAIDEAGNSSEWTAPALVKVGYTTVKTFVIIAAAVVVVIVLLALLPRFLPRKPERWTWA